MDDKLFVSDLEEGMAIDTCFVVTEKDLLEFKSKPGKYLQVKLKDKTGEIWGKCWEEAQSVAGMFDIGDVVRLRGNVVFYNGHLQVLFERRGVELLEEYDTSHFIATSESDVDDMYSQMRSLINNFANADLKALLSSFFNDTAFEHEFKTAPCAKSHHHNYIGGLIDHTYSVLVICRTMARLYPSVDRELLLAGALLHDVGKMDCYSVDCLINVTPEGGLYDHVVIGYYTVRKRMEAMDNFPKEVSRRLLHMLLSHHGKKEWGSPVVPLIDEACILYHADLMDSQTSEFIKLRKEMGESSNDIWSGYSRKMERFFYLGE
ncbi:MAG TPA: HD domain-containing protein [Candidatus Methanofastidiosa archaeon]|nr:HD domain-containing protein [Candidatus Methanofastidiosa archaeon]